MYMKNKARLAAVVTLFSLSAYVTAGNYVSTCENNWASKKDVAFATDCADMAFKGTLKERQKVAWMVFARINEQAPNSDFSPLWRSWPSEKDTFSKEKNTRIKNLRTEDNTSLNQVISKSELSGLTTTHGLTQSLDKSSEEVYRNLLSYDYIKKNNLITNQGVLDHINKNKRVDLPVGAIEIKAVWELITADQPAPENALRRNLKNNGSFHPYWFRGMHIMVKMQKLPENVDPFFTEAPSWFWTTFQFNEDDGVDYIRNEFITQKHPLSEREINEVLKEV